jgi:hypothetical protein
MQFNLASVLGLAGLAVQASAHGLVKSPATRAPGQATEAACGKIMAEFYRADNTSYPEALLRANPGGLKAGYDAKKCNLWLCKGYQFADNAANVQSYKAGQVVDLDVWIRIAHKGYANVSVVDTTSNSVIGTPLISWPDNYAASTNPPANQTKFSIKVPELGGKCTEAGACVSALPRPLDLSVPSRADMSWQCRSSSGTGSVRGRRTSRALILLLLLLRPSRDIPTCTGSGASRGLEWEAMRIHLDSSSETRCSDQRQVRPQRPRGSRV